MNRNFSYSKNQKKLSHEDYQEEGFIAGKNAVLEALKSNMPLDSVFISGNQGILHQISELAKERNIPVKMVTDSKLSQMTDNAVHQGAVATGAYGNYVSIEKILETAKEKGEPPFIIICDEIQDPHNLGAIIRTAEASGVHGVIIPKRRSASLNLTVGKTSAGAASWVQVARVPNLVSAMKILQENGVWIYGTDASGSDYTEIDFTGATAIVIGSEGEGMRRLTAETCDVMLKLPMYGKINSLNASVAGGIFMYEVVRQRNIKK